MILAEILANQPPVKVIPGLRERTREALRKSGKSLVVIDDDPTGMQTVQDVDVYLDWSVDTLRQALASRSPVLFVSINSRSLNAEDAKKLAYEVGKNLRTAVDLEKQPVLLASRSDSTLRGHFPYEVEALTAGFGIQPDGIIFAPTFLEAGRYTIDDIQWAEQGGQLMPVGETEFARDPMFSFQNSNLRAWIEEKTHGQVKSTDIISISLKSLREGGAEQATAELVKAVKGTTFVVNAAAYEDLDILTNAITEVENRGKKFVYRCSASFLKARAGFPDRALLTHNEMVTRSGPGLIIVGSYVDKTSRQLERLIDDGDVESIELVADRIMEKSAQNKEIERVSNEVKEILRKESNAVIYTSRQMLKAPEGDFATTGKTIINALCKIVRSIDIKPAYVVAKGGITSIEIARTAFGVKQVRALGQILPGVPVWKLGDEARWPGIPYVVFPGNVGNETDLLKAVKILSPA